MSKATRALKMDTALSELNELAEFFGVTEVTEEVEEQVEEFVNTGEDWAKKSEGVWQRTGLKEWTPVQTGNLAESVTTDVSLPYITVGVLEAKAPYSEAPNVGTKTGHGVDYIDAVWFEYAKIFGNQLFPGRFTVLNG